MMTPTAPAACALATLVVAVHVPRWIRAMLPAVKPAKSAELQPLLEVGVPDGGMMMPPAGCTVAVTSPLPLYVAGFQSVFNTYEPAVGETSPNDGIAVKLKYGNVYCWMETL